MERSRPGMLLWLLQMADCVFLMPATNDQTRGSGRSILISLGARRGTGVDGIALFSSVPFVGCFLRLSSLIAWRSG